MAVQTHFLRYIGNGIARSLSGFGFAPSVAWAHGVVDFTETALTHLGIQPNQTIYIFESDSIQNNNFTSLDSDGFSLGTKYWVNNNLSIYYAAALAGSGLAYGTYTGDGAASNPITGIGWQPLWVMVTRHLTAATSSVIRSSNMPALTSYQIAGAAALTTGILSLDADGFTVGSHAAVNANTESYSYLCFRSGDDAQTGVYNGDDTADRLIVTNSQPRLVIVVPVQDTGDSWITAYKLANMPGVNSALFSGVGGLGLDDLYEDYIREITSTGFQVGYPYVPPNTGDWLNTLGWTYYWMAIGARGRAYSIVY